MKKNKMNKIRQWSRKKKVLVGTIIFAFLVVIILIPTVFFIKQETVVTDLSKTLKSNQRIVYGEITQINGNEITYTVAELSDGSIGIDESQSDSNSLNESMQDGTQLHGASSGDGQLRPGTGSADGQQTSGVGTGTTPQRTNNSTDTGSEDGAISPDMNANTGNAGQSDISETSTDSESGSIPAKPGTSADPASSSASNGEETLQETIQQYVLTDQIITTYIPVATLVTTKLGTVTTFSRLAVGDIIEMVIETIDGKDVIMSVLIVE